MDGSPMITSKDEVGKFDKPKDVDWTDEDQKAFSDFEFFNMELWYDEAFFRMVSRKELTAGGGGGGGGCCVVA